jgi:uncharacterized protein
MTKKVNMSIFSPDSTKSLVMNLVVTTLTVVASVAALIYTTQFTGPLPISITQTTTNKQSAFNVTGESELITVPDQAQVNVGIAVKRSSVAEAQSEANSVANNISSQLKTLGIDADDIKTTNYSINPDYDYKNNRQNIIGYNVSSSIRVTVRDIDQVNQVIDTATAGGANRVNGVQFTLSKERRDELTEQAREEAIDDAKANAKELSGLAGMKLGKIVNVIEHNNSAPRPQYRMESFALADAGGAAPTQLDPGSTTFAYQVTLSYETL